MQKIFQPNLKELEERLQRKKKAVIVNSPNNPHRSSAVRGNHQADDSNSGQKQKELKTDIYLISDEPYRELAYDGVNVPYLTEILRQYHCGLFFQ